MSVKTEKTFLPDFCSLKMLLVVFFLAELLALLLTLAVDISFSEFLSEFAVRSLFSLWIALLSASVLCALKKSLSSCNHFVTSLTAFIIIQLIAIVVTWLVVEELPAKGYLNPFIKEADKIALYYRVLGVSSLISLAFLRYFYVSFQWKQQVKAKADAKLDALQARMRPHFLFNSLNSIASLTRVEPQLAEELIEDLAELIRASMQIDQALLVKMEDEIKLVKLYLAIEYHRLDQRLKVTWDINDLPNDALIPPLSIQPIVENSVYYGVEPNMNGAEILIQGKRTLTGIILVIRNTRAIQPVFSKRKGNKVAMNNLSARIAGCFGGDGRVVINSSPEFYQVTIEIPYRTST